ncbi:MAG: response regulator [Oscillospiraceae bacterium]|nr:response regulator [Oscillospiraceae bacterium]
MGTIMLVAEARNFLLASMQEQLEALEHKVLIAEADIDALNQVTEPLDAILLYAGDELLENQKALIYLRDKAVEDNLAVFMCGGEDEIAELGQIFPRSMASKIFLRPIDVKKLTQEVSSCLHEMNHSIRKKVLIVDDSGAMLRSAKSWLEEKYQVILANSGMMAIKYLGSHRPDLILLDYEMPVCDGRQVLEMIRSDMETRDIPVIFLTGKDDRESVLNVMALRPEGYLLKTLPPEVIVQHIDDFFANRKWQDALSSGDA